MNSPKDTYHHTNPRAAQNPSDFSLFDTAIIRFLLAGMYFVLGVRTPVLAWRKTYVLQGTADVDCLSPYIMDRCGLKARAIDWAGINPAAVKRQRLRLWLSSKAINNSPDPNIRRTGHDAWATNRSYPSVPGIGFMRLKDTKNNPHPEAARSAGTRRTRIMCIGPSRRRLTAAPQGEGFLLIPP